MIDRLPEGISIGWMQAPPQWIFTHTVRFVGIVRVVIQDGEGFILIQKGKPLVYYFRHGRIEMHGHSALDYFNSHPTIEFNLCKYTPEEMAEALRICAEEEPSSAPAPVSPPPAPQPERRPPEIHAIRPAPQPAAAPAPVFVPAPAPATVPVQPSPPLFEEPVPEENPEAAAEPPVPVPEPVPVRQPPAQPEPRPAARPGLRSMPPPPPPVFAPATTVPPPPPSVPQTASALDEQTLKIIGQIKKLNGVVAISVFSDDRNLILMGDIEIEPLLKIARSMLATSRKVSPLVDWGSFVHMTLQIPEGNVIVAPYRDNYLCLLTTRTINIGHIRRILRDIQVMGE